MKNRTFLFMLLVLLIFSSNLYATISVLPYRVISQDIKSNIGSKYASLLTTAIKLKYVEDVESQDDILLDIRKISFDSSEKLTKELLHKYGKRSGANYIISGDISYHNGIFTTSTILYSIRDNKIILRSSQNSSSLYKLARRELLNLLSGFEIKKNDADNNDFELAILIDSSYGIKEEWNDIKRGIISLSNELLEKYGKNTKIYLIPYRDNVSYANASVADNSVEELEKNLKNINPKGIEHKKSLRVALKYAINAINWNSTAYKSILIIDNTPFQGDRFLSGYALKAKRDEIAINIISLGRSHPKRIVQLKKLSNLTNGDFKLPTYHQTLMSGEEQVELYAYGANFFVSSVHQRNWMKSIFQEQIGSIKMAKPSLKIIPFSEEGIKGSPYTMADNFNKLVNFHLISKKSLQSNLSWLINNISTKDLNNIKDAKPLARVLLSNEGVTIWKTIFNEKDLQYLRKKKSSKSNLWASMNVFKSKRSLYGLDFSILNYSMLSKYIAKDTRATLVKIIKNKTKYINSGLFTPPVWFVKFSVLDVRPVDKSEDIRD